MFKFTSICKANSDSPEYSVQLSEQMLWNNEIVCLFKLLQDIKHANQFPSFDIYYVKNKDTLLHVHF